MQLTGGMSDITMMLILLCAGFPVRKDKRDSRRRARTFRIVG